MYTQHAMAAPVSRVVDVGELPSRAMCDAVVGRAKLRRNRSSGGSLRGEDSSDDGGVGAFLARVAERVDSSTVGAPATSFLPSNVWMTGVATPLAPSTAEGSGDLLPSTPSTTRRRNFSSTQGSSSSGTKPGNETTGQQRLTGITFPTSAPSSRAEVFFLADAIDQLLADVSPSPPSDLTTSPSEALNTSTSSTANAETATESELERLERVSDALFIGLFEASRHARTHVRELGDLTQHLGEALRSLFGLYTSAVVKLKKEVAVARGYDPAKALDDMHAVVLDRDMKLEAADRQVRELRAECERLEQTASSAAMWRAARDRMADVLVRQAHRNRLLLERETARLELDEEERARDGADGGNDEEELLPDMITVAERAVQVSLDAAYEQSIGGSLEELVESMSKQMRSVETLCAPFYSTGGFAAVSRPASVALAKLEDLTRRSLTAASRSGSADHDGPHNAAVQLSGRIPATVTKQVLAQLLSGCTEAALQIEKRVLALAERTDIRKLAYPLKPPTTASEPCELCGRTEVDDSLKEASVELERLKSAAKQSARAMELMNAERLALQEELELVNARLSRRSDLYATTEQQTDPVLFDDGSPPLQINLLIEPRNVMAAPGGSRKHRQASMSVSGLSPGASPSATGARRKGSRVGEGDLGSGDVVDDDEDAGPGGSAVRSAVKAFRAAGRRRHQQRPTTLSRRSPTSTAAARVPSLSPAELVNTSASGMPADPASSPRGGGDTGGSGGGGSSLLMPMPPSSSSGNAAALKGSGGGGDGGGGGGASQRRLSTTDGRRGSAMSSTGLGDSAAQTPLVAPLAPRPVRVPMTWSNVINRLNEGVSDASGHDEDTVAVKPLTWALRAVHDIYTSAMTTTGGTSPAASGNSSSSSVVAGAASAAPVDCRAAVVEYFGHHTATRKAGIAQAASFVATIRAMADSDGRMALMNSLLEDGTAAARRRSSSTAAAAAGNGDDDEEASHSTATVAARFSAGVFHLLVKLSRRLEKGVPKFLSTRTLARDAGQDVRAAPLEVPLTLAVLAVVETFHTLQSSTSSGSLASSSANNSTSTTTVDTYVGRFVGEIMFLLVEAMGNGSFVTATPCRAGSNTDALSRVAALVPSLTDLVPRDAVYRRLQAFQVQRALVLSADAVDNTRRELQKKTVGKSASEGEEANSEEAGLRDVVAAATGALKSVISTSVFSPPPAPPSQSWAQEPDDA